MHGWKSERISESQKCVLSLFFLFWKPLIWGVEIEISCVCEDSNPLPQRDEDQMGGGKEKKKKKLGIEFV